MRSEAYHRIEINSNTMTCHQATQSNNEKKPRISFLLKQIPKNHKIKRKENMTPIVLILKS